VAFSTRVFCREELAPPLSEVLLWLLQRNTPVALASGAAAPDLLSPFWTEAALSYDPEEPPLTLRCHRMGQPAGAARIREEVEDFLADLSELPSGAAVEQVTRHLQATRMLLIVEFPEAGVTDRGYEANGWLMALFVERAMGMVQCDGIGFYDDDSEVILRLG
jgi:hypothetical protein